MFALAPRKALLTIGICRKVEGPRRTAALASAKWQSVWSSVIDGANRLLDRDAADVDGRGLPAVHRVLPLGLDAQVARAGVVAEGGAESRGGPGAVVGRGVAAFPLVVEADDATGLVVV